MKLYSGVGILSAMLVGGAVSAADGVSVGGFVDAQYNWTKQKGVKTGNTFSVPDGAMYLNGKSGGTEVMVDLPFSANATDAGFTDFADKGQAFVGGKYDSGLNWKLGQYDSTLAYEANDSVDLVFSKAGLLAGLAPAVHRGLNVGYDFSDMLGVTLTVANPYMNSDTAGGEMTEGNPDFGAQVSANFDMFYVKVGGLFGKDTLNKKNSMLMTAQAGFNVSGATLALDFGLRKNRDTRVGTKFENGMGFGAHLGYAIDDMTNVATRFEYTKLKSDNRIAWTTGPQFKLSEGLTAKVDYTFDRTKEAGATTKEHIINVGAVHRF